MALNPHLFDTYKQYKAGTAKIVSWLAITARTTGLVNDMFESTTVKTPGRAKGKARKQQRKEPQKYQIAVKDFIRLAKVIASSLEFTAPENVMKTLTAVIRSRKECMDYFASERATCDETATDGHRYFVEVLEEVLALLRQNGTSTNEPNQTTNEVPADPLLRTQDIPNRFDYLEVEEPVEWTSAATHDKTTTKPVTYEVEASSQDASFALFCFVKDVADIRYFVHKTWTEYREHRITLPTAAVTMNAAISIICRLNDDFVANFPQFDDHDKIIHFVMGEHYDPTTGGTSRSAGASELANYRVDDFELSPQEFFCVSTFALMHPFYLLNELGMYRPDMMHPALKITEDQEILMKCLSHFNMMDLDSELKGDFLGDQLFKGLSKIRKDKKVYSWVVFAVEIFVDTRRVLGNQAKRGIGQMRYMEKWMSATYEQCRVFGKTNTVNAWYKINNELLSHMPNRLRLVREDLIQATINEYFQDNPAKVKLYSWGPFYLFENNPMLCGLIMQHFTDFFHDFGIGISGDQGAVMTVLHLYNACHQSKNLPSTVKWADLDHLIAWQGPSYIFVGDRPSGPGDCFRYFTYAMGGSAVLRAADRKGKFMALKKTLESVPQSRQGNRKLKTMSQYSQLSKTFSAKKAGPRAVPSEASREIKVMLEVMVAKSLEKMAVKPQSRGSKAARTDHNLNPLEMLSIFKENLQADQLVMNFDLVTLNERCIKLLRRIQKVCLDESPMDYPEDEYGKDRDLGLVISHMLAGEAGVHHYQPTRLFEASQMVKELAEAEGDIEYQKAAARCNPVEDFVKEDPSGDTEMFLPEFLRKNRSLFSQVIVAGEDGSVTVHVQDGSVMKI